MNPLPARRPTLPVRIAGTSAIRPGRAVSTGELVARLATRRDAADIEARTGVRRRYFADADATAAALGAEALHAALTAAGLPAEALSRIIFVSSSGGDVLSPATANRVAAALGLHGTCDCFDVNNACMGFLSALDIAARSIVTGSGPVGIVVGELLSRFITPDDPRPFLVFGDAVAAVVLDASRDGGGVLGAFLRNDGTVASDVGIGHPGLTGERETIRFGMTNEEMAHAAIAAVRRSTDAVLAQAALSLPDIEWLLPHQPNGTMLTAMIQALGFDPARVVRIVDEVGSVAAASIPLSLDRLLRTQRVRPHDRVLMVGVGAGMSAGALLLELDG
jgi:3-oxoacyl-[acyl-carrier-protein] synthase-3